MKRVIRITKRGKLKDVGLRGLATHPEIEDVNTTVTLIQTLIPLGLRAVGEALATEVTRLVGPRYSRTSGLPGHVRWGHQQGSVYLADQKLPITYQRVRDRRRKTEVPLTTYQQLQLPRQADAGLFRKVLLGLSCRNYAGCAEAVPEAFGLSPSSVSRRFIRASARQLQALQERRLDTTDVVVLLLDGKTFAEDRMVIALGITLTGEKVILGFVQTATENETVCAAFLSGNWWSGASSRTRACSVSLTARRGCGRRSRQSSAITGSSSAVSGINGRMCSRISRKASGRPFAGRSRRPMSSPPMSRPRPRSSGFDKNSGS
jgi:hypothetical protein